MSVVSRKEVEHVARLARLALEEAELGQLASQLDEILQYVRQLAAVSTEAVEPTSHVLPLSNVMRPDETRQAVSAEDVLKIAPSRHGQFVKVPKIVDR